MTEARHNAKELFLAALEIPEPAERGAFLDKSCSGDDALRQRVEDLLRAYGQSDSPLDKLAAALAPTKLTEPIREQVGASIGPYKLMEQIGEGGFGLVFVAEQQQPIRRKVALKIIKPGMDTRDVIARFEAERQALALMDHPNIARVFDAGTTESGRPYFVMELVRGIPITDYCDRSQLTPRERLELFVPVCNAIQHAHLKGIIHRDIKPSNVLVTLHDDRPVVKVIDFGVAKALHQHLTEKTVYTRFAQMIGTPLYMSPEQAQMSGLDIDTRTDVYSLGVLLYELLTGTTPFNKDRLAKAAYDELLKIIREEEPPKPSVRLSQSTDSLPSIAALRRTEPGKLSKMFDGDLDWIAMKALEKDRTRRYETANAFSADVLRYLNDEPVEASPPSAAYRLRKFARKHRRPVIALAVIVAVLVLGIVGTTWGLFRARQAEQAASASEKKAVDALGQVTQERDAKEAQRDRAERQLANGLLRPIGFANPAKGSSIPATDPAELRSFVDWSAIKESPLKLRVLEIALENPETALRIARRAERVIQSCVGLSPTRRAQAIKLVSIKQRDLTADPRIRIAACWLALELGSADLPAWAESCNDLADPKHKSVDRFGEFVAFAASRSDPQQVAQLHLEPLLRILATSTNDEVLRNLSGVLPGLAPPLDQSQARRAWEALIAILEKSTNDSARLAASHGLTPLAPRLEPSQVTRTTEALIAILEKSKDNSALWAASQELTPLAPRLEPSQVTRTAEALIAILEKLKDNGALWAASQALIALAPRLEPAQAKRAGDALVAILEGSKEDSDPWEASALWAARGFTALTPRLEPAQVTRTADALIAFLEKSKDDQVPDALADALAALAPRLQPAQAKRAWDALMAIAKKSKDQQSLVQHIFVNDALAALARRLEPAQAKRAWDELTAIPDSDVSEEAYSAAFVPALRVWVALAPRLEEAHAKRVGDAHIDILVKSENDSVRDKLLVALAPRLDQSQVNRAWDVLLAILEKSKYQSLASESGLFVALAPRLEASQAKRGWDALIAILDEGPQGPAQEAFEAFVALASRLEPPSPDKLSTKATTSLLDYTAWFGPPYNNGGEPPHLRAILIARSISSPRSLAKLLSHPGCVAELRQGLLHRFEELVFFDGKPVFSKPEDPSAFWKPETPAGRQHRFHNLHDAAAWIQQNWPDFDLETNCPVSWRGSR